jgi:hypothetical protein
MSLADELGLGTVNHDELVTLLSVTFPRGASRDVCVEAAPACAAPVQ